MLQGIQLSIHTKPGITGEVLQELISTHIINNCAAHTCRWKHSSYGWSLKIPRHKYNATSYSVGNRDIDLVMGEAQINSTGEFKVKVELGWMFREMNQGIREAIAQDDSKAMVRRKIKSLSAIVLANEEKKATQLNLNNLIAEVEAEGSVTAADIHEAERLVVDAECKFEAAKLAYPEKILSGCYVEECDVYQQELVDLLNDRKRGFSPYLLLPLQIESLLCTYIRALTSRMPFLDISTIRVTKAKAYWQWMLPDVSDLFAILRNNIIAAAQPSQRIELDKADHIRIVGQGILYKVEFERINLPSNQRNMGLLRMYVDLSKRELQSIQSIDFTEVAGGTLQIDWNCIVYRLRQTMQQIPISSYDNDLDLLANGSDMAKRVVAIAGHPYTKNEYLSSRSRPGSAAKKLDKCAKIHHPKPILDIPDAAVMMRQGLNSCLLHWDHSDLGAVAD